MTIIKRYKESKAITLIALVITIIVLLILAGISISMLTGESGLLTKADNARGKTIEGEETDQIKLAYSSAKVNNLGGTVTAQNIQDELDSSVGEGKTTVTDNGDGTIKVVFIDTNHNYNIENGVVSKIELQELHISNYSELLAFTNRINNDGETFENYIVYLDNDIQMEGDDWVVIGKPGDRFDPGADFSGIFEGNNHMISNLSLTTSKKYNGLFGSNKGTIRNLNVVGNISGEIGTSIGLICGINLGIISNCSANITCDVSWDGSNQYYLRLGGITGDNSGVLQNCVVRGEIHSSGLNDSSATGGIVGENCSEVINCKNYATIYRKHKNGWRNCWNSSNYS